MLVCADLVKVRMQVYLSLTTRGRPLRVAIWRAWLCVGTQSMKFSIDLQADSGPVPRYRGFLHALSDIVKTEGILGLYKGVGPTCGRATVLAAAELTTYDMYG